MQCNIRILGGLVSAHILATDSTNRLGQRVYNNELLSLAQDLGQRFLPAFDTPTGLPYAWVNLKVVSKMRIIFTINIVQMLPLKTNMFY